MDLITTHLNADFDGLASMVAARKLYPGAALVFPGSAQELVRNFLALHDLGIARLKDLDLAQVTRLILVDTQEPERLGPLKDLCFKPSVSLHVYDHHPDADRAGGERVPLRTESRTVEPVGATTTILIERLQAEGQALTPFEATVLALGLYEETGSLAYASTTPRDLEAAAALLRAGADLNVVSDRLRPHLDPDQITLLNDLLHEGETFYLDGRKLLLAASTYDRYRGDLAEVVHKLAELEGLDAVVAAIAMEDKVEIIGRSRRPEIDVGRLLQEFGGGGHAVAAAASVKGRTLIEVRERLAQLLTDRFRPTLLARDVMTKPVKAIGEDATVAETGDRMTKYGVNVLPVLDGRERYSGLVTREIIQKALFHGLAGSPIGDFLQTDQYTAGADTPFREIEARMIERNQRFVPILAGRKVIGVITRTDLLRALHDDVLLAARARTKGAEPPAYGHRRNIGGMLKERLPARAFSLLKEAGELGDRLALSVYVVGGFVRDLLLGIQNLDLDLVVEGDGIAFARSLGRTHKARVKVHERFGTAVVIFPDGFKLDVATARTEYYEYPTALPTVESSSIKKDLYRRDFTINTLAVRVNARSFGELIDFYGGQRDLKEGTIRVLHSLSFVEDPTRVFRAVRFETRFGFHLGKETLALIRGAVKMDLFHRLSGHRLLEELILLLSEEEPRKAVARLGELDLLRFIHPALKWSPHLAGLLKGVEQTLDWHRIASLGRQEQKAEAGSAPRGRASGASADAGETVSRPGLGARGPAASGVAAGDGPPPARMDPWLVYFMALMEVIPPRAVGETLKRLTVPERYAEKVRGGHAASHRIFRQLVKRPPLTPAETYRLLKGRPEETLLLLMAKTKSEAAKRRLSAYLTSYQRVKPALTGVDLKAMGLKPGPQYKKILDRLLEARLNGQVTSEADERELVKQIARL